jgi:hypothetical protein
MYLIVAVAVSFLFIHYILFNCVVMQPRQSFLSAASRVGEVSQDIMTSVEQDSTEDKEFKVYGQQSVCRRQQRIRVTETE